MWADSAGGAGARKLIDGWADTVVQQLEGRNAANAVEGRIDESRGGSEICK
jgi:hypothetical protein